MKYVQTLPGFNSAKSAKSAKVFRVIFLADLNSTRGSAGVAGATGEMAIGFTVSLGGQAPLHRQSPSG